MKPNGGPGICVTLMMVKKYNTILTANILGMPCPSKLVIRSYP